MTSDSVDPVHLICTYVDNHIPNDFVIANQVGILLFRLEKAAEEILLVLAEFRVLHALHEALYREAGCNGEVVELVD